MGNFNHTPHPSKPMNDKKLMQITPGIHPPWFVKGIELNPTEERIDLYLDLSNS